MDSRIVALRTQLQAQAISRAESAADDEVAALRRRFERECVEVRERCDRRLEREKARWADGYMPRNLSILASHFSGDSDVALAARWHLSVGHLRKIIGDGMASLEAIRRVHGTTPD